MSSTDKKRTQAPRSAAGASDQTSDHPTPERQADDAPAAPPGRDMGDALRSVYDETVNEAVPDEMMDLLGKLG